MLLLSFIVETTGSDLWEKERLGYSATCPVVRGPKDQWEPNVLVLWKMSSDFLMVIVLDF